MENLPQNQMPNLFQMISEKGLKKTEVIRQYGGYSLQKIITDKLPSIGQLQKQYGSEKVENVVAILIADLSTSFDGDLKKEQIIEIAIEITSTITRNITLEGVFVACQEIKRADIYGKLSVNKVLKHINQHLEQQCKLIEQSNLNAHLSTKFVGERNWEKDQEAMREAVKVFKLKNNGSEKQ